MGNALTNHVKISTIAVSGTAGTAIELEDYPEIGCDIPALDSTTFKLQVSTDEVNVPPASGSWRDVYDGLGNQVLIMPANTGARAIGTVDMADILGYHWVRPVCGSAQNTAARSIVFYFRAPKET